MAQKWTRICFGMTFIELIDYCSSFPSLSYYFTLHFFCNCYCYDDQYKPFSHVVLDINIFMSLNLYYEICTTLLLNYH